MNKYLDLLITVTSLSKSVHLAAEYKLLSFHRNAILIIQLWLSYMFINARNNSQQLATTHTTGCANGRNM